MPSQQETPLQPIIPNSTQFFGSTPQGPFPFVGISHNPFPPGTVPLGLNHLRVVPLGHYPSGQIPFLFPTLRFYFTPIMAMLSLVNIILGVTV